MAELSDKERIRRLAWAVRYLRSIVLHQNCYWWDSPMLWEADRLLCGALGRGLDGRPAPGWGPSPPDLTEIPKEEA